LTEDPAQGVSDAILAGGLVTAPAWAEALSNVNMLLTMLSLAVGLLIGLIRLWHLCRDRRPHRR
jgi:hypothetical protein